MVIVHDILIGNDMKLNASNDINPEDDLMSVETYIKILYAAVFIRRSFDLQIAGYLLELSVTVSKCGYALRGSDQCVRASIRVQAIGIFMSHVTTNG